MTKPEMKQMVEALIEKVDASMGRIMEATPPSSADDILANVVALRILADSAMDMLPDEGRTAAKLLLTATLIKLVGVPGPETEAH